MNAIVKEVDDEGEEIVGFEEITLSFNTSFDKWAYN